MDSLIEFKRHSSESFKLEIEQGKTIYRFYLNKKDILTLKRVIDTETEVKK